METTYTHPRITPRTRTFEIVDQVAAALQAGQIARLGRWRAQWDDDLACADVDFGDDTTACRAGGEPAGGWWTESSHDTCGNAAQAMVDAWMADNGGAK